MRRKEVLAYIAGYFDGEGCIGFTGGRNSKKGYSPKLSLASTNKAAIAFVHKYFEGAIRLDERSKRINKYDQHQRKDCYYWSLAGYQSCKKFLSSILPHLLIKKDQTLLMLEYIDLRLAPNKITHNPLTAEQATFRDNIFLLNRRHPEIMEKMSQSMKKAWEEKRQLKAPEKL